MSPSPSAAFRGFSSSFLIFPNFKEDTRQKSDAVPPRVMDSLCRFEKLMPSAGFFAAYVLYFYLLVVTNFVFIPITQL